jgi:PBSX family phage terminase large subunit
MEPMIELSPKQVEFVKNATHRYNFKIGATQCGKTFIDVQYVIPNRIMERKGKNGLVLILGVTRDNIERNVLEPMRDIWGSHLVTEINNHNCATIFGQKVYCLGAEKVSQVSKLRGAKFKYVYIDEVVDINEEVFELLKSRLSLEYSICDGSGNPSYPHHFVKKFIDSGADVYVQHWTIYDNPFIPRMYVKNLELEYKGTVYYDRYVLGMWTKAEGLIFPMYVNAIRSAPPNLAEYTEIVVSLDYGTQNPLGAIVWGKHITGVWYGLDEYRYSGRDTGEPKTDEEYANDLDDFALPIINAWRASRITNTRTRPDVIVDPSASSFITLLNRRATFRVLPADNDVADGLRNTAVAMKMGRVFIDPKCTEWAKEAGGYVYKKDSKDEPLKVDDHLMDATRYFVQTKRIAEPAVTYKSKLGGR